MAAALLVGAFAYAQDIPGSPTADQIDNLPGSPETANRGLSIQNGNDHKVKVMQAGTAQSAYTVQDDGSTTGGNQALVRQTGNVGPASGVENFADVLQTGGNNQSTTLQEGDYNNAVTRQGQNDDASANNKARIQQGVAQIAEGNRAAIDQDGQGNLAQTLQTDDNNDAWTTQLGEANKSRIRQVGAPDGSDGHEARNYQEGNANESYVHQSGAGGRNVAQANQIGDSNRAWQIQATSATSGSAGNTGVIRQGVGGPAQDFQDWTPNRNTTQALADPLANIWAVPPFGGEGNTAYQRQYGEDNRGEIWQVDGTVDGASYAEQHQEVGSSGNTATIGQGHYFAGEAGNYAKQYQSGQDNNAGLYSSGSGQKALQDQRGNSNEAYSSQLGANHKLNVHQRGDDNVGATGQRGTGNDILLTQWDGQSYTVQQNLASANPFTANGGNQADILQMGPDGDFGAGYIDCAFDMPEELTIDYSVPELNLEDICPDCD